MSGWSVEKVKILEQLLTQGLSYRQISLDLSAASGERTTRNAVMGFCNRTGLTNGAVWNGSKTPGPKKKRLIRPRKLQSKTQGRHKKRSRTKPVDEADRLEMFVVVTDRQNQRSPEHVGGGLVDLAAGDCRWPIGDPGTKDFCFCRAPSLASESYCDHHSSIAYQGR